MKTKKEEKHIKRNRVRVGLTDDEFFELKKLAQKENLSPSGFLKKELIKKLRNKNTQLKPVEPINDNSRNRVWATIPDNHFNQLKNLAEKEGLKTSDLVRNSVYNLLESTRYIPKTIQDELQDLKFLLRNVANNINQMAWHSNRIKYVVNENQVFGELQKLEKIMMDFVASRFKRKENDS